MTKAQRWSIEKAATVNADLSGDKSGMSTVSSREAWCDSNSHCNATVVTTHHWHLPTKRLDASWFQLSDIANTSFHYKHRLAQLRILLWAVLMHQLRPVSLFLHGDGPIADAAIHFLLLLLFSIAFNWPVFRKLLQVSPGSAKKNIWRLKARIPFPVARPCQSAEGFTASTNLLLVLLVVSITTTHFTGSTLHQPGLPNENLWVSLPNNLFYNLDALPVTQI